MDGEWRGSAVCAITWICLDIAENKLYSKCYVAQPINLVCIINVMHYKGKTCMACIPPPFPMYPQRKGEEEVVASLLGLLCHERQRVAT